MKGRETGKVYVLFGSLAAAFSSPMNGLIKGDLTHKERGPVDEKISTEKKGDYHDACLQPKGQKDTGIY